MNRPIVTNQRELTFSEFKQILMVELDNLDAATTAESRCCEDWIWELRLQIGKSNAVLKKAELEALGKEGEAEDDEMVKKLKELTTPHPTPDPEPILPTGQYAPIRDEE